ncbi:bifunctional NAD(P)/FAD-dependent oxidoreductase/class I SAM-dependent methyltransferase [Angustibacter luteus]|uniref:Bifunctional NAD(P)/FAD-dependent oxidoreductase/class I SAM-dependent methyltransferase n=1 Tax=Angustibacter luteus TaxID=658456 RepID=A0ABW1JG24_9ACTN
MNSTYDVVIVGGGAAGLSGALALARSRRSVLVVDAGSPRNAPAGHVHNYLGREGTSPLELLEIGRAEVASYGGEVVDGEVVSAQTVAVHGGTAFAVTLADGRSVHARRLLVTTGLVDELPDVPGLAQRWGRDVLHCPYCHGWEVRDQAIGVLATSALAVHQALLFRQWSADVTLFSHTTSGPDDEALAQLAARGIRVVDGEVAELVVDDDRLTGARLASGDVVALDALVVGARVHARSAALSSLGIEPAQVHMGDVLIGTLVPADPMGATSVPGVYVAGNVTDPRATVIGSAAAGFNAGAALNADLIMEETAAAVAAGGQHQHGAMEFDEASWEDRYRSADSVWSGRPNAQLVAEVADLEPGSALEVGCGEGADSIWLAERGWRVTGADFSTVALARAAGHAEAAGPAVAERITWTHTDLTRWTAADQRFDLVTAHFMHLPREDRVALFAQLAQAVAPGGTLLIVGHHILDLATTMPRHHVPGMFYPAEEVAETLDPGQWDVVVAEARPRQASDPDGREVTLHDAVLRAVRHG